MINKPPAFKGRNIWIHIIIPTKGRGFINHGFTLSPNSPWQALFGPDLELGVLGVGNDKGNCLGFRPYTLNPRL